MGNLTIFAFLQTSSLLCKLKHFQLLLISIDNAIDLGMASGDMGLIETSSKMLRESKDGIAESTGIANFYRQLAQAENLLKASVT